MKALVLALSVGVAACGTVPAAKLTCLPLKAYTPQEQGRLAVAVAALPPGSDLIQAMLDYQRMRDADRACAAAKP